MTILSPFLLHSLLLVNILIIPMNFLPFLLERSLCPFLPILVHFLVTFEKFWKGLNDNTMGKGSSNEVSDLSFTNSFATIHQKYAPLLILVSLGVTYNWVDNKVLGTRYMLESYSKVELKDLEITQ